MIYPTTVVRYIDTAGAKLPVMPWHRLNYECASFSEHGLVWFRTLGLGPRNFGGSSPPAPTILIIIV